MTQQTEYSENSHILYKDVEVLPPLQNNLYGELSTRNNNYADFIKEYEREVWKKPTCILRVASDTEFVAVENQHNKLITTQIAFSKYERDCELLEHPDLGLGITPTWNTEFIISTLLDFKELVSEIPLEFDSFLIVDVLMYFSPTDVLQGMFRSEFIIRYIQQHTKQTARYRVQTSDKQHPDLLPLPIYLETTTTRYRILLRITDLCKITSKSLQQTAESLGIKMLDKSLMDRYKQNMLIPYTDPDLNPLYKKYGKRDVTILFEIDDAQERRVIELYSIHGLKLPGRNYYTPGVLTSNIAEAYISNLIGEYKAYEFFTKEDKRGNERPYTLKEFLNFGSVEYFVKYGHSRKQTLALIQGGRAKNERPTLFKLEGAIADADIKSAYATLMKLMVYPLGIPRTFGMHKDSLKKTNSKMTIRKFISKYGKEFEPRLWFAVISGELSYHQTLIHSKIIDALKISDKYDEERAKIPADLRQFTQQILNGILTTDIYEVAANVCSDKEWSEFLNIEVIAATWYPKQFRCNTAKEWFEKTKAYCEKTPNKVVDHSESKKGEVTYIEDKRSRFWLAIPLEDFLNPYIEKRTQLKNQMNDCVAGTEMYTSLSAQQESMKLVPNTMYGCTASPAMDISNVVVGNCITAGVRAAIWCMSIATAAAQSITDGCQYDLNAVRDWTDKKPSMNTLSLWHTPELLTKDVRKGLITKPLASEKPWTISPGLVEGEDYYTILSNGEIKIESKTGKWVFLNEATKEHIIHFFRQGRIRISILNHLLIEHKDVYSKALFHGQTDYHFHHIHPQAPLITRARGHKVGLSNRNGGEDFSNQKPYNKGTQEAAILRFFEDLDIHPHQIPPYKPQTRSQVLTNELAKQAHNSYTDNIVKQNNLYPGDTVTVKSFFRPISIAKFHFLNKSQYDSWKKANETLKKQSGWGLEQYFLNSNGTVDYQKALQEINLAILQGRNWITSTGANLRGKNKILATHPYLNDNQNTSLEIEEEDLGTDLSNVENTTDLQFNIST